MSQRVSPILRSRSAARSNSSRARPRRHGLRPYALRRTCLSLERCRTHGHRRRARAHTSETLRRSGHGSTRNAKWFPRASAHAPRRRNHTQKPARHGHSPARAQDARTTFAGLARSAGARPPRQAPDRRRGACRAKTHCRRSRPPAPQRIRGSSPASRTGGRSQNRAVGGDSCPGATGACPGRRLRSARQPRSSHRRRRRRGARRAPAPVLRRSYDHSIVARSVRCRGSASRSP